jgi:uncharacterized membrane protein
MKKVNLTKFIPYILVTCGLIGLFAAFTLTMEKFEYLKNPNHIASCDINPVLSCGTVTATKQASAFNFPNPFLGLMAFASVVTIGMGIFAGAKYKKWFWQLLQLGVIFGIGFVIWLMAQSIYVIQALCLYCMITWAIMIPLFWYVTLYNFQQGNIKTPRSLKSLIDFIIRHHLDILIVLYLIVIAMILEHFWYYWKTLI